MANFSIVVTGSGYDVVNDTTGEVETFPLYNQAAEYILANGGALPDPKIAPNTNPQVGENGPAVPPPASSIARSPSAVTGATNPQVTGGFVFNENGELIPADSAEAQAIIAQERRVQNTTPATVGGDYTAVYNSETGKWDVYNLASPDVPVVTGLTEQQAILEAQNLSIGDPGYGIKATNNGVAYDDDGNLLPGWSLDEDNNPVFVGGGFVEPATQALTKDAATVAAKEKARLQAVLQGQQQQANQGDWRVKLRLAPGARYLYRGADGQGAQSGILKPLADTDGVVFPYTPAISTNYKANYTAYNLTHSNYRGYFYQGSNVEALNVTATFTAQDTYEANYLLAVIHFFRSVTKMFYGQDDQLRGAPPPLVFLQGLGQYQFNLHPCVVANFTYTLPADVDYIRAGVSNITGANFQVPRQKQNLPTNIFSGALTRLAAAGLPKGGVNIPPAPTQLGTQSPTYVPTRMEIQLELYPIQSRQQVSREFSLEKFANGNLQRAGFW
jgi:hypothetical protein